MAAEKSPSQTVLLMEAADLGGLMTDMRSSIAASCATVDKAIDPLGGVAKQVSAAVKPRPRRWFGSRSSGDEPAVQPRTPPEFAIHGLPERTRHALAGTIAWSMCMGINKTQSQPLSVWPLGATRGVGRGRQSSAKWAQITLRYIITQVLGLSGDYYHELSPLVTVEEPSKARKPPAKASDSKSSSAPDVTEFVIPLARVNRSSERDHAAGDAAMHLVSLGAVPLKSAQRIARKQAELRAAAMSAAAGGSAATSEVAAGASASASGRLGMDTVRSALVGVQGAAAKIAAAGVEFLTKDEAHRQEATLAQGAASILLRTWGVSRGHESTGFGADEDLDAATASPFAGELPDSTYERWRLLVLLLAALLMAPQAAPSAGGKASGAVEGYDARCRAMLRRCAALMGVRWELVAAAEDALASRFEAAALASPASGAKQRSSSRYRWALIGGAAIVGAGALVLTGGLAAPGVAAGIGVIGGALGGAVGTAVVTAGVWMTSAVGYAVVLSIFGAAGSGLASYRMTRRTAGLSVFRFRRLSVAHVEIPDTSDPEAVGDDAVVGDEAVPTEIPTVEVGAAGLHVVMCVAGLLDRGLTRSDEDDFVKPWGGQSNGLVVPPALGDKLHLFGAADPVAASAPSVASVKGSTIEATLPFHKAEAFPVRVYAKAVINPLIHKHTPMETDDATGSSVRPDSEDTEEMELERDERMRRGWMHARLCGGDAYALVWEPTVLRSLQHSIEKLIGSAVLSQATSEVLKRTVLSGLLAAWTYPSWCLSALSFIDSPWAIALDRAAKAGVALADVIESRQQGRRPVSLVGYSVGARVIFEACLELSRRADKRGSEEATSSPMALVDHVVLLGAPVSASASDWQRVRRIAAGRVVNVYNSSDFILRFVFRANTLALQVAGTGPVGVRSLSSGVLTAEPDTRHSEIRVESPRSDADDEPGIADDGHAGAADDGRASAADVDDDSEIPVTDLGAAYAEQPIESSLLEAQASELTRALSAQMDVDADDDHTPAASASASTGAGEAGAGEAGAGEAGAGAGAGEASADAGEASADEASADAGEASADEASADAGEASADAGEAGASAVAERIDPVLLRGVIVGGVESIDASPLVSNHLDYSKQLERVLACIGFEQW